MDTEDRSKTLVTGVSILRVVGLSFSILTKYPLEHVTTVHDQQTEHCELFQNGTTTFVPNDNGGRSRGPQEAENRFQNIANN